MLASCMSPCGREELLKEGENSRNAPRDLFAEDDLDDGEMLEEDANGVLPNWLRDKEALLCFGCHNKFSTSIRRHHCRRCRLIFCNKCSSQKSHIVLLKTSKPVRVCNRCSRELVEENAYLEYDLPKLQKGNNFKTKAAFGIFRLSSKFVCLRLLSDGHTLVYDDDSSNDITEIPAKIITNIALSGFATFDIVTDPKTYTFEAENADICENWTDMLKNFMSNYHTRPLKEVVEEEKSHMRTKCSEIMQNHASKGEQVGLSHEEKREKMRRQRHDIKKKYDL